MSWYTPGTYPVADGVYRIPMPLPGTGQRALNMYVIEESAGLVAIDAGWAHLESSLPQLRAALASVGRDVGHIRSFLITHAHRDHYPFAVEHRNQFGSRVSLGAGEAATVDLLRHSTSRPYPFERRLLHRAGLPDDVPLPWTPTDPSVWGAPDRWIYPGERFEIGPLMLTAIPTPGHTRGHMVFHDPGNRLLFAGDHILPDVTPGAGFEPSDGRTAMTDYVRSLEAILALEDALLLPAHGPVERSVHERCRSLLTGIHERTYQCVDAIDRRPLSAYDVAQRISWTRLQLPFSQLSQGHQARAVLKVVTHLDHGVQSGWLDATEPTGITYYCRGAD